MNKYTTILFDLDDTLLDFKKSEQHALKDTFAETEIGITDSLYKCYHEINTELWKEFEKGTISKNEVVYQRFDRLFKAYDLQLDAESFNKKYLDNLSKYSFLIEGALTVCKKLSQSHKLYAVTNGVERVQKSRFKKCGLEKYFSGLFISEEIGYSKPSKKYFDFVLSNIEEKDKTKIIIVGDSLTSDIQGGINCEIDTCLVFQHEISGDISPTYKIKNIGEFVMEVLRNEEFKRFDI